jgi:hypothetical protein
MDSSPSLHNATYEDAIMVGRILDISADTVWAVIRGMNYSYYSELKIAVLNSPFRSFMSQAPRYDA